jgi:hypothetical protein
MKSTAYIIALMDSAVLSSAVKTVDILERVLSRTIEGTGTFFFGLGSPFSSS